MKFIPLTQGRFTFVDDEDFDALNKFKWYYERGYACRKNGKKEYMHKVINQTPEGMHTDHIDGNRLNNTRGNLRSCTASQNIMNRKISTGKSSAYKGVSFYKRHGYWVAGIMRDRKDIHLGVFDTEIEAARAYNAAATKLFGEFARLNIIQGAN